MKTTISQLVTEAKEQIRNLSVDEVAARLDSDAITLVDIRERDEIERDGSIPGAVIAPRGMLEFWADPTSPYHREEFSPQATTILYCASSGRSALAVRALEQLGYADVSHLEGGLRAWKEHGRPVTYDV